MTVTPKKRLLTTDEYRRMFEAGILTERDRVELINGEILEMSPIGNRHAALVDRINNFLAHHLYGKAIVRVQSPIIAGRRSEPEPDLAILRWKPDYYLDQHPRAADILLLIEVADSSIQYDREVKIPLYASAGIPLCWLVDVAGARIDVYRRPRDGQYASFQSLSAEDRIDLPALDLPCRVRDLIG